MCYNNGNDYGKGRAAMRGNKIVLDLEFTPLRDPDLQRVANNEIIEIGAVKLDEQNKLLDEFQLYVKPQYSSIPSHITKITGITEETVADAPEYPEAIRRFTAWVGDSEPSRFYTWSTSDQNVILREADLKEVWLADMYYAHWVDLQRIHQRMYGFARPMNLTNALGSMQIYFNGTEHGALADARNTAEILRNLSSVQQVHERIEKSRVTYNNTEAHGFTMGLVFRKR